jgi:hypothetical protein
MRVSIAFPICAVCVWFARLWFGGSIAHSQPSEPPKDTPAAPAEARKSAWLHEIYLREASEYDFYLDAERREKLELRREPTMRYMSPGDYRGEVYVWTHQGRPAVIGCIFSAPFGSTSRRVMHELHSLAPHPIFAGEAPVTRWQPEEAGITFEPITDAPEPARDDIRRLAQMRTLVRGFSAHMARQDSQLEELRLLPQPLFRYEPGAGDSQVVDGAVFGYVWTIGTDPEVLLVIEARRAMAGGQVRWHFAPARFTNREAWVKYQKREVWRVASTRFGSPGMTSRPYGLFVVKTIPNQVEP